MSRTRTRQAIGNTGSHVMTYFGYEVGEGDRAGISRFERCVDVNDSPGAQHFLELTSYQLNMKPLNGQLNAPGDVAYGKCTNHPSQLEQVGYTSLPHATLPDLNYADLGTKVFARTNPSRPVVSVPAFVGELKDIPSLFKLAGETMLKKGANAWLSYQYGWKPLIKDLEDFLDFQKHVKNRESELRRLYSGSGLRRKIKLEDTVKFEKRTVVTHSSFWPTTICDDTAITQRNVWGTARWFPDVDSIPKTSEELHNEAVRAVFGLSLNISDAWELMPWSWLIDWSANVGDFLNAYRNSVGAHCTGVCVMTRTATSHKLDRVGSGDSSDCKGGDGNVIVVDKKRNVIISPSITASIPFLNGTQLSILGALGIQRMRGIR